MNFVLLVLGALAILGVFVWINFKKPTELDGFEDKLRELLRRFK